MTATVSSKIRPLSRIVNGLLAIKPLALWAKHQARSMMIKRSAMIGVDWHQRVADLKAQNLEKELTQVQNPDLVYPDYYLRSFHAYEEGNLGWEPATEVEVAAYAVHSRIWSGTDPRGDARLRQSYHEVLLAQLPTHPARILDIGCSVGMSTLALQETFPQAQITGLDLSPYFLAVARGRSGEGSASITWKHAPAESTELPDASVDLVSACLLFHELPQQAARQVFQEAHRLLRPGGSMALMDMNPHSEVYAAMPPYILTLLKSTEPYLDQYFSLDLEDAFRAAGFQPPRITCNSPRHRVVLAQVA
ncbi:MAG: class I SAM-dependent methyltransferase [Synechococcaceae cyanobacterium SM2_3_1]|nr:class I SAM-dependent methyltransferase [Synechococcaceae cyanobacterium SM2_3_1]